MQHAESVAHEVRRATGSTVFEQIRWKSIRLIVEAGRVKTHPDEVIPEWPLN